MNNYMNKLFIGIIIVLSLISCDDTRSPDPAKPQKIITSPALMMEVIKLAEWENIRRQYQSKILVADLWASWCISCIERFPAMIELSKKYQDQPVQFISLNLDDPSDIAALNWSNSFLKKVEANFPNYHLQENIMYSFEQLDLLGIPVVLVYDKAGVERYRLTGDNPNSQFGEDDVEKAINTLLTDGYSHTIKQ